MTTEFYKPAFVFKNFSFVHLFDETNSCVCTSAKRLRRFLDPKTLQESSDFAPASIHVRSVDVDLIQHKTLRQAVSMGLNHIPLKPTELRVCISTILDAFSQVLSVLRLESADFPIEQANEWIRVKSLERLKAAKNSNKFGFCSSEPDLFSLKAVKSEVEWITEHLYCAGLDKASNNICFICVKHIRLLALDRLMSPDFSPCKDELVWQLRSRIIDEITHSLRDLVPEIKVTFNTLPYLMATYKVHKNKYRWLTNAFHTVYSNLAHILTIATMLILECEGMGSCFKCRFCQFSKNRHFFILAREFGH